MSKAYKPGNSVPVSGIYRVYHDSHRLMHEAALIQGAPFPACKKCKDAVRFELVRPVESLHIPFRDTAILESYRAPVPQFAFAV